MLQAPLVVRIEEQHAVVVHHDQCLTINHDQGRQCGHLTGHRCDGSACCPEVGEAAAPVGLQVTVETHEKHMPIIIITPTYVL